MKYYIIILSLLVLITACTGSINTDDNNGIVINKFDADPDQAETDDRVNFFLDVENVGGTTAKCVVAEIYGVDSWYDINGRLIGNYYGTYGAPVRFGGDNFQFVVTDINGNLQICYRGGLIGDLLGAIFGTNIDTDERVCYTRDRNDDETFSIYVTRMWDEFTQGMCSAYTDASNQFSTIKVWPSLEPPLPQRNRPGQFVTTEWIMKPPVLPQGVSADYPVTARVKYWYSSNANINIRAYNKEEYRRMTDLGQATQSELDVVNSFGSPIHITVQRGTNPIIVNQRNEGYELANYLIELQNTGSGFPLPIESDVYGESGLVFGTIEVRGPGAFFYDCLGQQNTNVVFLDGLTKIRSDNTAPFGCVIGIDRSVWADRPTDTISIIFNLHYVYYVDAQTSVKISGVENG